MRWKWWPSWLGANATRPALRHYRAILMKTKNRYYLGSWEYGKWQLYGRDVKTVQNRALHLLQGAGFRKLHLNQDGIKRGGVAQVGKFF